MVIRRAVLFIWMVLFLAVVPVSAQTRDDTCSGLVEDALTRVGAACGGLGRNQACYGFDRVAAVDFDNRSLSDFAAAGDIESITSIATLATAALNTAENIWGVAVLSLQADLPETLPGQNVTFVVFGDTKLVSEVEPRQPSLSLDGQTAEAANVRSGPGTEYAVMGGLGAGEAVTVRGRNEAGDWLAIAYDSATAWVFAPLVLLEGETSTLSVIEEDSAFSAPMQAFRFSTGIGQPACEEAPRDGLLVQAPADTTVHFRINGIDVEVGSTALLHTEADILRVNTFDGLVSVTAAGETRQAEPGMRIDVTAGQPPAEPVAYDVGDVINAPVTLLPDPVDIPPPDGNQVGLVRCSLTGGAASVPTGTLILRMGWADISAELVDEFDQVVTQTLVFDGDLVEMWSGIGPVAGDDGRYASNWYWVIPDVPPGQYGAAIEFDFARPFTDGDGVVWESLDPFACTITVEG